ncbi:MAG TPA: type VI secretion system tip protein TssI/VgrG, partial [Pirellulaceae bacterium]|nr:type VI secretion system tip protein TssI/VgrG [Pirellulaceae bacterium]
ASHDIVRGTSSCRSFVPGHKFTVAKHYNSAEAGGYVLTSVKHSASVGGSYSGSSVDTGSYRNEFTCIPDKVTFRPARITPKPLIHGVQTAVVVGPGGEEIYTDKYGRVKLQYFWDREGKRDEKSSCWVRVSQWIAGKKWGSMFIPRIGQEVIVTYLDGDPDRPLITGEVYNAEQMPAYDLPDHKTKTGIKTNSSKGGDGFNEIRFDDKANEEQFFLHAERNFDLMVEKDYQEKIGGNMEQLVGKGRDGDGGNQHVYIENDKKEFIGANHHHHVSGNRNEKVDGTQSLQSGNLHEKIDSAWAIESGQTVHIKAGMSLVIEAGMQLSLKVGGNFIDISVAGIAINGMPMVMVNSGGAAGSGMGASPNNPEDPEEADPMEVDEAKTGSKSAP